MNTHLEMRHGHAAPSGTTCESHLKQSNDTFLCFQRMVPSVAIFKKRPHRSIAAKPVHPK